VIVARSSMIFWCGVLVGNSSKKNIPLRLHITIHQTILNPKVLIITHFNLYYIANIIITETIIIFNCYGVTATQLTTFVLLCSFKNITLKMAAIAAETFG